MYRKKYLTTAEIEEMMNASSDEEEAATDIRKADHVDLVVLPPDRVDAISDDEQIDENELVLNDVGEYVPNDVAGPIEVHCEFDDDNVNRPDGSGSPVYEDIEYLQQEEEATVAATEQEGAAALPPEPPFVVSTPKWSKRSNYEFSKQPVDLSDEKSQKIYDELGN